jgi:hypothetical protein
LQQLLGLLQSELHTAGDGLDIRQLLTLGHANDTEAVRSTVVNGDGRIVPVEITGHEVELEKGRRVVHGVFRPLAALKEPGES